MITKIVFCILLPCASCKHLEAQMYIGLQVGISDNYFNTNIINKASTTVKSVIGYSIGVPFQFKITNWLFFRATPNVTQKNYSINRTDSLQGVYTQYNNTYLQLPLLMHFAYGERLQIFGTAGTSVGYWVTGYIKGKTPNIFSVSNTSISGQQIETFQLTPLNQKYEFDKRRDNRIELGWIISGGLQYNFSNNYIIFAECSYNQSLTDQQKKYMINQAPQYNQTITVSIGGLYSLKFTNHVCKTY